MVLLNPMPWPYLLKGSRVFYTNPDYLLAVERAVWNKIYPFNYSKYVPVEASSLHVLFDVEGSYGSGDYGAEAGCIIQAVPNQNFLNISIYTPKTQFATNANTLTAELPVTPTMSFNAIFLQISGQFNAAEWPNLTVAILGYTCP